MDFEFPSINARLLAVDVAASDLFCVAIACFQLQRMPVAGLNLKALTRFAKVDTEIWPIALAIGIFNSVFSPTVPFCLAFLSAKNCGSFNSLTHRPRRCARRISRHLPRQRPRGSYTHPHDRGRGTPHGWVEKLKPDAFRRGPSRRPSHHLSPGHQHAQTLKVIL